MASQSYSVVGMMSGTSLDGMDLVLCRFKHDGVQWNFEVIKAETTPYTKDWKKKLSGARDLDILSFLLLHNDYGTWIGQRINKFLSGNPNVNLVASHGHTIFHQPAKRMTLQLGSGSAISAACGITTVADFRTLDVSLGGQGAPLVPVGDELLFHEYQFCLNLGGFANISNNPGGIRIACDLCPVNIVANHLAAGAGKEFDEDGILGSEGVLSDPLVNDLNALKFYDQSGPKSLGIEWVEAEFLPILEKYNLPVRDALRSVYEHISIQICRYINAYKPGKVLVTGGGAFNKFLIDLIRKRSASELLIPDENMVKFKEAVIFAFLGLLRFKNEVNCLSSVTGATRDSSTGTVNLMI